MIKGFRSTFNFKKTEALSNISVATIALVVMAILTRAFTVVTHIVIASQFGMSIQSDAYFATETIPEIFISIVAIGFSMVFIPAFAKYQLTDPKRAQRFANSFLLFAAVISFLLATLFMLAAPMIVNVLAPGFGPEGKRVAIPLVRVMALSILFLGLDGGVRGLLHVNNRFIISEVARILYNASLLVAAFFFSDQFGVIALAWGVVVGAAMQLLLQGWGAFATGNLKLSWEYNWADTKLAVLRLIPFIFAVVNIQLLMFIDRMVASNLTVGSLAALNFALRIILLPIGIFALPLRTTIYPDLSKYAAQFRYDEMGTTVLSGLKFLMYSTIPAAIGITALRLPLTRLLFERGAFDAVATQLTSEALVAFAFGVPAIAMIFVLNNVFLALGNARLLIVYSVASWGFNWLLNNLLLPWGHIGISLATSITSSILAVVMILTLTYSYLPSLNIGQLARSFGWICLISAIMGSAILILSFSIGMFAENQSLMSQMIEIVAVSVLGAAVYLAGSYLFKLDEFKQLLGMLNRN